MLRIVKLFNLITVLVVIGMTATSCTDELDVRQSGVKDGYMQIAYTVDGFNHESPTSRAEVTATAEETKVNDVYVLFFSADAPFRYIGRSSKGTAENGLLSIAKPNFIETNVSYKTLIVGNGEDNIPSCDKAQSAENQTVAYDSFGAYIDDIAHVNTSTKAEVESNLCSQGQCELNKLPMYGEFIDGRGEQANFQITDDGMIDGTVCFRRAVARLELVCSAENLNISKVALCNQPHRGFFFHDGTQTSSVENYSRVDIMSISDVADNTVWHEFNNKAIFYVYPTCNDIPGKYDTSTVCFMLQCENAADEPTYYRFNIVLPGKSQTLERNNSYKIDITEKITAGEHVLGWAYNPSSDIVVEPLKLKPNLQNCFIVEGFDPSIHANPNGVAPNTLALRLRCQSKYAMKVLSTFDPNVDAFISMNATEPTRRIPLGVNNADGMTLDLKDGNGNWMTDATIYFHAFRTGPDDIDFDGKLLVQLFLKDNDNPLLIGKYPVRDELQINVTVTSSCIIGDAIVEVESPNPYKRTFDMEEGSNLNWLDDFKKCIICDRNFGAPPRIDGNGKLTKGKNYSYGMNFKIGGRVPENEIKWVGSIPQSAYKFFASSPSISKMQDNVNGSGTWWDKEKKFSPWYAENVTINWRRVLGSNGPTHVNVATRNMAMTKLRCIIISDWRDPETGKYVANYVPFYPTPAIVGNKVSGNGINSASDRCNKGPGIRANGHGIYMDFNGNLISIASVGDGGDRGNGPERPIRWINETDWNNYLNWCQTKYGNKPLHR